MNYKKNHHGYILPLSLMILSLMTIMIMQFFKESNLLTHFDAIMVDRERAKMLAYGGIQLAISQLTVDTQTTGSKELSAQEYNKELLKKIIPVLNQPQEIALTQTIDGIDGIVTIRIVCESGKININQLYDFQKHAFKKTGTTNFDGQKVSTMVFENIQTIMQGKNLIKPFEKFIKQRQFPLDDATILLTIPELQDIFGAFVFPPINIKEAEKNKKRLYLTDIFTVWSNSELLNPAVLSDSIITLFGLKKPPALDNKQKSKTDIFKDITFTERVDTLWDNLLQKRYGKEFKSLSKEFTALLSNVYEAKVFSIFSSGIIGNTQQKLLAIVERQDQNTYIIKKLYCL